MKIYETIQRGLLAKFQRIRHSGFTLIELLATLTIMAIIAAILFPFIGNYTAKANHDTNVRSLRLMQDAMDRFRALNDNLTQWGGSGGTTGTGSNTNIVTLSASEMNDIIGDITTAGTNQTLRIPADGLTNSNVVIVRTGSTDDTYSWEVMWYRKKFPGDGVDRKASTITNGAFNSGPTAADIDDAFSN